MTRNSTRSAARSRARRMDLHLGPWGVLALLLLAGCAGPATASSATAAAAAPSPGYAPRQDVHIVANALNQKLDGMLAAEGRPAAH